MVQGNLNCFIRLHVECIWNALYKHKTRIYLLLYMDAMAGSSVS